MKKIIIEITENAHRFYSIGLSDVDVVGLLRWATLKSENDLVNNMIKKSSTPIARKKKQVKSK
jgi:hypothetical protein